MLKLISQFDNEKMRASVATPTCGPCCCCCCCCIVTTIAAPVISTRMFGKAMHESKIYKEKLKKKKGVGWIRFRTYTVGFFLPVLAVIIGTITAIQIEPIWDYMTSRCMFCADNASTAGSILVVLFFAYFFLIWIISNFFNIQKKKIFYVLLLTPVFFFGEMLIWLFFMDI